MMPRTIDSSATSASHARNSKSVIASPFPAGRRLVRLLPPRRTPAGTPLRPTSRCWDQYEMLMRDTFFAAISAMTAVASASLMPFATRSDAACALIFAT